MSLKIYTYPDNFRVWKSLICAQYNGVDIELPAFDFSKDLKTEAFKAKNPMLKVPVLETPQGCVFESGAIMRYVARLNNSANLLGGNSFQQALVDQWIDWCTNELEPVRSIWLYPIFGYLAFNDKAYTEAKKDMNAALTVLNDHLASRTFMVGNQVTCADIVICTALIHPYQMIFTANFIKPYTNVNRWFATCINQPEFSKVIGAVNYPAKEEAQAPKAAKKDDKKEDKKAEASSSKPAAKKEDKPAAKPAAAAASAADDGLDDEDAPKPKKKNPLDDLPPSSMDLDTVKKMCFAQRPFAPDFFEKLWPMFDPNGYCWYTCDYNYNADNKEYWKIGNTLGGFIQRSDACRKYAMGSIQCAGPEDEEGSGPWYVTGAWLFRGPTMIAEMKEENPDSEYYTWTKIDVSTDAGKAKVKEYFLGTTVNGQKVLDRRFFK